ncbi:MAG: SIR2 family protein, partial [Nitrososphaera sp.]|nr:SIR2 family protein [Nitrososphaera sp.]
MNQAGHDISEQDLVSHFAQNASQLMWFLGAGTSRSARMPTATDIIWDLKRRYYCLHENQNLQAHDVNNEAIRQKIQRYSDSKGFPALWSAEEYSFYFELTFGQDYGAQQKYINEQLDTEKISLTRGHRVFAASLEMGILRVAFTTNFDEVIESAYAEVTGKHLSCFHLEGSYAALEALNAERFPIYAKIHGDFRYQSIKNLSADLIHNDKEIQRCFIAAATRFGMIVTGYSGRDANVMEMFRAAVEQNNAFPSGLFWVVTKVSNVSQPVNDLIAFARSKGIKAHIVESGTFDILLSKIWRHLPNKPEPLDSKVCTAKANAVSIALPAPGEFYPILRTNGLVITDVPKDCGAIEYAAPITIKELHDKAFAQRAEAVVTYTDRILFWGSAKAVSGLLDAKSIRGIKNYSFEESGTSPASSTIIKSFFEQALAQSLCANKPVKLRRKGRALFAVVDHDARDDERLESLKLAVGFRGTPASVTGSVPGMERTFWAEALSIRLEHRNDSLWLLIEPDIWISPLANR